MSPQPDDARLTAEALSPPALPHVEASPPNAWEDTAGLSQGVGAPAHVQVRRGDSRSTRAVVRKVGPWSVLRFSLLFYFCVMLVVILALAILYWIMGALGVLDSAANLLASVGFGDGKSFEFNGGWIFIRIFLVGVGMVILGSLVNLFAAFLYNLVSDVVGGIEVTLAERR